ncbi:hypothetical protein AWB79_01972 [Caballeronia hypogeia]|uniref:Uncharacterized protein n=1 Tax=Caballeronia hypogeia TaxID=1777140 RepID=A0A158A5D9_9BURK|nr:hypothetical protein [Caballeronia hypogeia]SAK53061.1 hypothetical protein AWB79_01972 [Caballeronia hypogeia]
MSNTALPISARGAPLTPAQTQQARQSARDFLEAVNTTQLTNRTLPPVRALQARLLHAWREWAHVLERYGNDPEPSGVHAGYVPTQTGRITWNMIGKAIPLCSLKDPEQITSETVFAMSIPTTVAALYLMRSHAVVEPTPALQSWLARTDVGDDIPASFFRLPLPAIFLKLGPELLEDVDAVFWRYLSHPCTTQGFYVFETPVDGGRELVFCAVGNSHLSTDVCQLLRVVIEDERASLVSAVRNIDPATTDGNIDDLIPMVELCAKVMLYLQTPNAIRIDEMRDDDATARLTRVRSKKASRIERKLASRYNRIIIGPAQFHGHSGGEVSPHWRRGHMRMQAHGPQMSLRKLIFIAPTLIRADRLNESGRDIH